jgi:hypothetical protein
VEVEVEVPGQPELQATQELVHQDLVVWDCNLVFPVQQHIMQVEVEEEDFRVPQVPAAPEEVEPDLFLELVLVELLIQVVEVVAVIMLLMVAPVVLAS